MQKYELFLIFKSVMAEICNTYPLKRLYGRKCDLTAM